MGFSPGALRPPYWSWGSRAGQEEVGVVGLTRAGPHVILCYLECSGIPRSSPCSPEFWVFIVNSDWFSATPTLYSLDIWPLLIKPLMVTRLEPELQFDTSAVGAYSQWTWEKGQESQAQRSKGTQLCEGLTCDWGSGWQWAGTAEEDSQWDKAMPCQFFGGLLSWLGERLAES